MVETSLLPLNGMFCEGTMFSKDASILNLQFSTCMVFVPRFFERLDCMHDLDN